MEKEVITIDDISSSVKFGDGNLLSKTLKMEMKLKVLPNAKLTNMICSVCLYHYNLLSHSFPDIYYFVFICNRR